MYDRLREILDKVCCEQATVDPDVLEEVILLAVEIAREGREGRKIGTLFTVGDSDAVMRHSRSMILDPLFGHPDDAKRVTDHDLRETIKELAQIDGAFVVTDAGVVKAGARYLDAPSADIDLPLGLGSRHMAGAAISRLTRAIAVVVSESSIVRIFINGELISEIIPEVWMLRRHGLVLRDDGKTEVADDVAVVTR